MHEQAEQAKKDPLFFAPKGCYRLIQIRKIMMPTGETAKRPCNNGFAPPF
jgi:hypothetical protein